MPKTTAPTPDQAGRWVISKFGPPSVLKWETFDHLPEPSDGEILVQIVVGGISGVDNIQRAGGYVVDPRCIKPGFTPGYDLVGRVVKAGPASSVDVGDLVASMCVIGAHATHVVLSADDVMKLELDDDPVKMAALPLNYMTAYGMLVRSKAPVHRGSSILIGSASGGVGTAIAQLAVAFQMDLKMFGTSSPSKFDYLKSLGVTPIDRHSKDIASAIREATGGIGVDVAYDAVGSKESLDDFAAAVKEGTGRVVVIGVMASIAPDGSEMLSSDYNAFEYISTQPIMSFFSVTADYCNPSKHLFLEDFEKIAQKVRGGELKPAIGRQFRLSDAIEANKQIASGAGVMGKMVFLVDGDLAASQGI